MANRHRIGRVLLSYLLGPASLVACSCVSIGTAVCDTAWAKGDVIFAGTVASIVDNGEFEVRFSPLEILRGAVEPAKAVVVHTGRGGGDCGYPFAVGTQYLVYASGFRRLTTSICSQTAPAAMVSATIDELRKLRDRGRSDDLFGNIGTAPAGHGWADLVTVRPLAGVRIHAVTKDGRRFETMTDEQGAYRFASIPAVEYSVQADLPRGFHHEEPQAVDPRGTPQSTGCRFDLLAKPDGRISGRVTDATGAGVAGFIAVRPVGAGNRIVEGEETGDGRFSLELLPAGEYRLVFHRREGRRINILKTFYFPADGAALKLELGAHVDNVRFEITRPQ